MTTSDEALAAPASVKPDSGGKGPPKSFVLGVANVSSIWAGLNVRPGPFGRTRRGGAAPVPPLPGRFGRVGQNLASRDSKVDPRGNVV